MRSGWELFKGKNIFIAHYDHMTAAEVHSETEAIKEVISLAIDGPLLVLVDTTDTLITPEILNLFKEMASLSEKYVSKRAIIGLSGPRQIFLKIVMKLTNSRVMSFDDLQTAKNWLVS